MFSLVQKSESPNQQEPKIAIVGISPFFLMPFPAGRGTSGILLQLDLLL
jgi:hypothetical protein